MEPLNKILEVKELANGVRLTLIDNSRTIAGDRWFLKLDLEAFVAIPEAYWTARQDKEAPLLSRIRELMGDKAKFSSSREKHFVDDKERPTLMEGLLTEVHTTILPYLSSPAFADKLIDDQFNKTKTRVLQENRPNTARADDDDDGPADFSHCFRD